MDFRRAKMQRVLPKDYAFSLVGLPIFHNLFACKPRSGMALRIASRRIACAWSGDCSYHFRQSWPAKTRRTTMTSTSIHTPTVPTTRPALTLLAAPKVRPTDSNPPPTTGGLEAFDAWLLERLCE